MRRSKWVRARTQCFNRISPCRSGASRKLEPPSPEGRARQRETRSRKVPLPGLSSSARLQPDVDGWGAISEQTNIFIGSLAACRSARQHDPSDPKQINALRRRSASRPHAVSHRSVAWMLNWFFRHAWLIACAGRRPSPGPSRARSGPHIRMPAAFPRRQIQAAKFLLRPPSRGALSIRRAGPCCLSAS
jgi:hypothetical protein